MLGAVGFDTEVLEFIANYENIKSILVTYDSYCSHSMMSTELTEELGLVLEPLGPVVTHSFMGNLREEAYKTKANIKTSNKDITVYL